MGEARKTPAVADVAAFMEDWAPAAWAEPWDRVGLLAGDPAAAAAEIWVALDWSPELSEVARSQGVGLILTHHPAFLKPIENLSLTNPHTKALARTALDGPALFAAHTNLDVAPGGVNHALAEALGLVETKPLVPAGAGAQMKLVTFVPREAAAQVAAALFAAGAGQIGKYRECAFSAPGLGSFLAPADGNPRVGRAGEREQAPELRLETILPRDKAAAVVAGLKAAHPYEEPAFDLYRLEQDVAGTGLGRVGRLARPMEGREFISQAVERLGSQAPAFCGPLPAKIVTVAVLGGSGGDFLSAAAAAGADIYITGEASYHAADQAVQKGICLLTAGHHETEAVILAPWARRLREGLARLGFDCKVKARSPKTPLWRGVRP